MLDKARKVLKIINSTEGEGEARIVGGYVRNSLLDIPTTDIDIATTLTPGQVMHVFEMHKIRVIPTGVNFGTVTVVYEGTNFEITTLRTDDETDGRHAKVSYTNNWELDASRRDFTFNALYQDYDGKIYDYFNGREDLKNGIVRFIGKAEDRIKEDYLRILRYFRFHACYGKGGLLPDQLEACSELAEGLEKISGERIHAEMIKLLPSKGAAEALHAMLETGVLTQISLPSKSFFEIDKAKSIHEVAENPNPMVVLSAILRQQTSEPKIDELADKWRLSNRERFLLFRLMDSLKIDFNDSYQVRRAARNCGKEEFQDYIVLNFAKGRITKFEALKHLAFTQNFVLPEFPIKSFDLIDLGVLPGKRLGNLLREAEEIWERAEYALTKEEIISKLNIKN